MLLSKSIEKVAKEKGIDEISVKNILHRNLDKLDNDTVYKFIAKECTGINNFEGTCYANGVVQFLSPLAEDIEFDNIKSFINKYCPSKRNDYDGATLKEIILMLKNVVEDIQTYDKRYISFINAVDVIYRDEHHDVRDTRFLLLYYISGIDINIIKNLPLLLNYQPKSFLINLPEHICTIRVCNNKLKLFDDIKVHDLNFSLNNFLKDPNILNEYFNEKEPIKIIGIMFESY